MQPPGTTLMVQRLPGAFAGVGRPEFDSASASDDEGEAVQAWDPHQDALQRQGSSGCIFTLHSPPADLQPALKAKHHTKKRCCYISDTFLFESLNSSHTLLPPSPSSALSGTTSFNANADAGHLTAPGDSPAPSRLPPWQLGDIADSHQRQQSAIDARCLPTSCEAVPAATASLAQQQQLLEQQSWWRGCGHTGLLPLALPLGPAPALHHQWRQYQAAAPLPGLALRTALPAQPAHQASLQQGCLEPGLSSGVELECGESFSEFSAGILPLASALPLAVEAPSRCPPAGAVLSLSGQGSGCFDDPFAVDMSGIGCQASNMAVGLLTPQGAAVIESPCLSTCATPAAGRVCGHAAAAPGPAHADASAAHDVFDPAEMLAGLAEANAMLSRLQVPEGVTFYPVHESCESLPLAMHYSIPPIAIALAASYFQRLLAYDDAMMQAAHASGFFIGCPTLPLHRGGPLGPSAVMMRIGKDRILRGMAGACLYLAAKVSDRVRYRGMLTSIISSLVDCDMHAQESRTVELGVLERLDWRLGPFFDLGCGPSPL
ncbi:hypothetical protein D9Q98_009042 [Chlorella vulgaris]|uniref:Uncharacterized protein n=1 Tax=Chlorella vulgaris TaxID=3077 RepID=A0A9D4YTS4_CHLVU|nr:hypothetical protein D9Q98_009042 [Chlorella vulgaris]